MRDVVDRASGRAQPGDGVCGPYGVLTAETRAYFVFIFIYIFSEYARPGGAPSSHGGCYRTWLPPLSKRPGQETAMHTYVARPVLALACRRFS
jgi:hypothetical protein